MAFICEELQNNVCVTWTVMEQDAGFLPVITAQERDQLLVWFIGIFVVVFALKMLRKLLGI